VSSRTARATQRNPVSEKKKKKGKKVKIGKLIGKVNSRVLGTESRQRFLKAKKNLPKGK
jgi:hypothetical protein